MISERLSQLLTAYIDGELGSRQRRAVKRLLEKSSEARSLLQQMQADAGALRSLPRNRLEQDLSHKVLRTISDRRLRLNRRAAILERPAFPTWGGYVAAAAVLLAVFSGSYLYFYAAAHPNRTVVAQKETIQKDKDRTAPVVAKKTIVSPSVVAKVTEPALAVVSPVPEPVAPKPDPVAVKPTDSKPEVRPSPVDPPKVPAENTELGTTSRKIGTLSVVDERLAVVLAIKELDQESNRKVLRESLAKDSAFRVEIFSSVRNERAFERLEAGFKAKGVRFVVDQLAKARLKNRQQKTDYVLYIEDLTAPELAQILETLGQDDKKLAAQTRGVGQFGHTCIVPLTTEDHRELSKLLNVDPTKLDPPTKGQIDVRQPISSTTLKQVQQLMSRQAIVLAYHPQQIQPGKSKEIRTFLDNRKPRRPGTLQILLVLHAG